MFPDGPAIKLVVGFCRLGTKLVEHYEFRAKGPDMRSIVRGTRLGANHIFIPMHFPVLEAGVKAKTLTACPATAGSLFLLLSMLGFRALF
jgi:hypothetical protein